MSARTSETVKLLPSRSFISTPVTVSTVTSKKDVSSPTPSHSLTRSLAVCLLYGCTSVCITFFNKAIFSVYEFRFPCFLTLLQIVVCLCILSFAHALRFIKLTPVSFALVKHVYPLTLCWWTYVVSGIAALRFLNIPMFSTLRKCTALVVLILEALLLSKHAKPSIWLSILIMVGGGIIAGLTDLSFSHAGYVLVFICCFATALYLILIVKVGKHPALDTFSLLYLNNLISFPLMLSYLLLFSNELAQVPHYKHFYDAKFWAFLLFSAAQATLLNVAIFLCTRLNSPLATTVTGQMKDFVTVGFGLFVFGDVPLSVPNLVGLTISLFGSVLYSLIKLVHARKSKQLQRVPSVSKVVSKASG
ncbi:unnamed protein product [Agarophyton chilense]